MLDAIGGDQRVHRGPLLPGDDGLMLARRRSQPDSRGGSQGARRRQLHDYLGSDDRVAAAAERGHNLGSITAALLRLLARYGAAALETAVLDALRQGVPHPNAVRLALERARDAAGLPPPIALMLPEHVTRRDAPVRPHALGSYDRLEDDDDND